MLDVTIFYGDYPVALSPVESRLYGPAGSLQVEARLITVTVGVFHTYCRQYRFLDSSQPTQGVNNPVALPPELLWISQLL